MEGKWGFASKSPAPHQHAPILEVRLLGCDNVAEPPLVDNNVTPILGVAHFVHLHIQVFSFCRLLCDEAAHRGKKNAQPARIEPPTCKKRTSLSILHRACPMQDGRRRANQNSVSTTSITPQGLNHHVHF